MLTTANFPFDLDTTSIGLTVSNHVDHETKMGVMDEMLTYLNKDGIIQTYFDVTRPRIGKLANFVLEMLVAYSLYYLTDPIVCTNVLTFFHMNGRGHELDATLDWVYSVLQHRAYLDGTLYYYGADTFLFFLSRLLSISPSVYARFAPLFAERCLERFGAEGDALGLAMRVIAGATVRVRNHVDYERLLRLQEADGSFPLGWVYKYGGADILIGNKGLTTALAVEAVKAIKTLDAESFQW